MIIGIPKEVKNRENRVSTVPGGVNMLTAAGHKVFVQKGAGVGAGIPDQKYAEAGAIILDTAEEVWAQSEMIIKVKEPIAQEYPLMREGQILYTYLHLAAATELGHEMVKRGVTGIAYETVELDNGSLPLLTPMSEVAGRLAVQEGARFLQKHNGGKGILLGGVPGVRRSRVTIVGGGIVGINSAKIALGMGARVTILDINPARLAYLDDVFGSGVDTLMSNPENVARAVAESDLVVGAVLLPGARAPRLVTREMVKSMEKDSVITDVAIDQGGCVETIRPTTHDDPAYVEEDVVHYAVTNIPGDVPMTSTYALSNVTLRYALELANKGAERALAESRPLLKGLNIYRGKVTHESVATAMNTNYEKVSF